ncbi:PREDICTED: interleukin-18 [Elephantulus edwardii]|uniref:interleukin-18 n=1 Tax=Elephantulus edwardii TaxID=28737 RepID=UPI0003F0F2A2|nr:PREDICTED: interleukin-18 [Elephantulus edwardii]
MAAKPVDDYYINFVEMKFIGNTLYFIPEDDGNLESDHFQGIEPRSYAIIRNIDDQVLFIDQGKRAVFEDMPDSDCRDNASQILFIIKSYGDDKSRGRSVAISVNCAGRISTLSCENKTINFKEISPPDAINDDKSDIIFFMKNIVGHHKAKFESSLYQEYFLACEKDADYYKLILKERPETNDKSIIFTVDHKGVESKSP